MALVCPEVEHLTIINTGDPVPRKEVTMATKTTKKTKKTAKKAK
jgi:hypothetical protein